MNNTPLMLVLHQDVSIGGKVQTRQVIVNLSHASQMYPSEKGLLTLHFGENSAPIRYKEEFSAVMRVLAHGGAAVWVDG